MTAALGLAEQGFEVVLIEKESRLGGLALENARLYQALKADYESFSNFHYRLFDV